LSLAQQGDQGRDRYRAARPQPYDDLVLKLAASSRAAAPESVDEPVDRGRGTVSPQARAARAAVCGVPGLLGKQANERRDRS